MILLADFNPILPEFGQFFWTTIIFLLVWLVLSRVAFKPIAKALKDREQSINEALSKAESARREMSDLKAANEAELQHAREESARLIKEAKVAADGIIAESKEKAKSEANRIVAAAQLEIQNQKAAAITDLKNASGQLALEIAAKVLQRELSNKSESEALVSQLVKDVQFN
jgi:F-type H+-transporting ATPase subunit b